ncbi:MAG: exopolysaccharide biosynthesis protein [Caloramator sp.]|nr:exopolysaccharide biosynthesis protein [Caloramator sp.]
MIDIHCHILPFLDDGSKSLDMSKDMLNIAYNEGINMIIATPHYYPNIYEPDAKRIEKSVEELNNISNLLNFNIKVLKGQEIFLTRNFLDKYKEGKLLTLNDTKYMLIELPFDILKPYIFDMIYELRIRNIVPIIAHPERYSYIIKKPSTINQFIDEGCLFQINSQSITGDFGREIKNTALKLIKHNICHFIATDAHSNQKRIPTLKKSFDIAVKSNKEIKKLMSNNQEIIINNGYILQEVKKIKDNVSIFHFK